MRLSYSLATSPVLATCGLDLDARARRDTRRSSMEDGRGLGGFPCRAMLQSEAIVNIDLTPRLTLVSRLWPPKTLPWLDDALKHSLELSFESPQRTLVSSLAAITLSFDSYRHTIIFLC